MKKTTKTLFACAAIAGLAAGSFATQALANDAGKPAEKQEHKEGDKNSCSSKDGCNAHKDKDKKADKNSCNSKDGCNAHKDDKKAEHKEEKK